MKLLELFDKGAEAHWFDMSDYGGSAEFIIGEQRYRFMISEFEVGEDYDIPAWTVEFSLVDKQGDPRYDNTGTGNQFPLYSTILGLVREFFEHNPGEPRPLIFGAADSGRKTLYARMFKKFLPGWTVTTERQDVVAWPPGMEPTVVPA